MRQYPVFLLVLLFVSCGPTAGDLKKVKVGMTRSEVTNILGQPKKISDGYSEMRWWSNDSVGKVEFMDIEKNSYESWEYGIIRHDSLATKGDAILIDILHDNLRIKQPTNMFVIFAEYRVVFDRTTGRASFCGYAPLAFIDRINGGVQLSGRVER